MISTRTDKNAVGTTRNTKRSVETSVDTTNLIIINLENYCLKNGLRKSEVALNTPCGQ
jgi:hypothetical protein